MFLTFLDPPTLSADVTISYIHLKLDVSISSWYQNFLQEIQKDTFWNTEKNDMQRFRFEDGMKFENTF